MARRTNFQPRPAPRERSLRNVSDQSGIQKGAQATKTDGEGYDWGHLKKEFGLLPNLSRLFHLVKCWQILRALNSDCMEVQEMEKNKKKKFAVLCSRPPQNVRLGFFTSSCKVEGSKGKYSNTILSSLCLIPCFVPLFFLFFFFAHFTFNKE